MLSDQLIEIARRYGLNVSNRLDKQELLEIMPEFIAAIDHNDRFQKQEIRKSASLVDAALSYCPNEGIVRDEGPVDITGETQNPDQNAVFVTLGLFQ